MSEQLIKQHLTEHGWAIVPDVLTDEEIQDLALASERVKELLDEQEPKRVIVRPPALINIVV